MMKIIQFVLFCFLSSAAQTVDIINSGGPLMPEQAAYDVSFYDLDLIVSPEDSSITGAVEIRARIVQPVDCFVVDLDTLLRIDNVIELYSADSSVRVFRRDTGKVWIELNTTRQAGEAIRLKIFYGGKPRIAKNPPWQGGFTWAYTASGLPWIATSCQGEGPDIWWPVKDHISDKPDSMAIHVRVPHPLICASNGKLLAVDTHNDNSRTFHWFVSTPVNNYAVALNIAPYKLIEEEYVNPYGENFPFKFWVLPEDYDKGIKIMSEFMEHMYFFEEILGPYPFRADKYGVAQTPHLGMEHQTIIAYGASFNNSAMTGKDWGFDALHHHELSHEWWGNLVTNADWKDMWLHEGIGTYMQALYLEKIKGISEYHAYILAQQGFKNIYALAPLSSKTSNEIWKGHPVYSKGATVLHVLRYLIGADKLRRVLRLMIYPEAGMEKITDGSHTRFVSSNDLRNTIEQVTGNDMRWFFDVYVYQPYLPKLSAIRENDILYLSWQTPQALPFPMPVDIKIGDKTKRIQLGKSVEKIILPAAEKIEIDPEKWLLYDTAGIEEGLDLIGLKKYQEARDLYSNILTLWPGNMVARKMIQYTGYAIQNSDKFNGNYFDNYLVSYKTQRFGNYTFVRQDDQFYLITTRGKYRIFPVGNNSFVFLDFDGELVFDIDSESHKKYFVFEMHGLKIRGEEITN